MYQGRLNARARDDRRWNHAGWVIVLVALDSICWFFGILGAALLRFDFSLSDVQWTQILGLWAGATLLQLGIGYVTPMYRRRFVKGTFEEVHWMTLTMIFVGAIMWISTLCVKFKMSQQKYAIWDLDERILV